MSPVSGPSCPLPALKPAWNTHQSKLLDCPIGLDNTADMYIGQTRFWWDNERGSIGVRSSNMRTGSFPFECYLKKRWDLPAFQIYETDNDGIGSEIRLSLTILWFTLNMLLWSSDQDPPIKPGDDKYAMNHRRWGWHWMDRWSFWWSWNWWHWSFDLPWLTKVFVRCELLDQGRNLVANLDDEQYQFKTPGGYYRFKQLQRIHSRSFPYRYDTKDGVSQFVTATICVQRYWRRRKWWPFERKSDSIDITFSEEVGECRGSWKGGCIGCSYELRDDETPEQSLRRMEKERRFDR